VRVPRISISYRRADTDAFAGRVRDTLVARYGRESVFIDVDNIPVGKDFRKAINDALIHSDILLVIIGKKWLGPSKGAPNRINEDADQVRIEVETALRHNVEVIPLLVGRTPMIKTTQVPDSIRDLSFRNAARVDTGGDFHLHMDRLISAIDRHLVEKYGPGAIRRRVDDAGSSSGMPLPLDLSKSGPETAGRKPGPMSELDEAVGELLREPPFASAPDSASLQSPSLEAELLDLGRAVAAAKRRRRFAYGAVVLGIAVCAAAIAATVMLDLLPYDVSVSDRGTFRGPRGGPFSPSSVSVKVRRSWAIRWAEGWLTSARLDATVTDVPVWLRVDRRNADRGAEFVLLPSQDARALAVRDYRATLLIVDSRSQRIGRADIGLEVASLAGYIAASLTSLQFSGPAGGPFEAGTMTVTARSGSANWELSSVPDWLDASPRNGVLADGAQTVITFRPNERSRELSVGSYGQFVELRAKDRSEQERVRVELAVRPWIRIEGPELAFAGNQGGTLAPNARTLTLTSPGNVPWTLDPDLPAWLSVTPPSGELVADKSVSVTVAPNSAAERLPPGRRTGQVVFRRRDRAAQTEARTVVLDIMAKLPGQLSLRGPEPVAFNSFQGGEPSPSQVELALTAAGAGFHWRAEWTANWIEVVPSQGDIADNGSTTVVVRPGVAARSLAPGSYDAQVTFHKDGGTSATRGVRLNVTADPRADCDRAMAIRFDADRPASVGFVADTNVLSDTEIEQAITACSAAQRLTLVSTGIASEQARRFVTQAGRAYAERAWRRAKGGNERAARGDMDQALGLWNRAAADGSGAALNFLGVYHIGNYNVAERLEFVKPNPVVALDYWAKGIERGNVTAMANAGGVLLGDDDPPPPYKNVPRALTLLTDAAARGESKAARMLGMALYLGSPPEVTKDQDRGLDLLGQACRDNDQRALNFIKDQIEKKKLQPSRRPAGC
jgi:hypothetical protein